MLPHNLQDPRSRAPISYSRLLLVEGHDAFEFFKALLRHLGLLEQVEIRNFGGSGDLRSYLRLLKVTDGFTKVISLGVVRDAEISARSAFQSVCSSLRSNGLAVPRRPVTLAAGTPQTAVFILPDCQEPGMLETLCLRSVSGDAAMACVDTYFQCLQQQGIAAPANLHKARLRVFLASRPRAELLLGQAAHEGYWIWDHPAFERIKQFLRAL